MVRSFPRAQDACGAVEFGAGFSVLDEGATRGAEGIQLGGYFLGGRRRNLIDALLFLSYRLFGPVLTFSEHACPSGFSNHAETWRHVEYLRVNEEVAEG